MRRDDQTTTVRTGVPQSATDRLYARGQQEVSEASIPPDHLISPLVGRVGFTGLCAKMAPVEWQVEHTLAEHATIWKRGIHA